MKIYQNGKKKALKYGKSRLIDPNAGESVSSISQQ